ncbi:MAG: HAD hydrolase family protein, partial [Armatimonadota bacterium]
PISGARCEVLRIAHVVLGRMDKREAVAELLAHTGVAAESAVYIGDDISDLPAMHMVGLGVAVADAVEVVRAEADWVTERPGGHGAVREVCDAIIEQLAPGGQASGELPEC